MKSIDFNSMVKGFFPAVMSTVFLFFFPLLAYGVDVPLISTQVSTINLPQTEQTDCYDSTGAEINCLRTGQDGEIRAGVEWPEPRFTISRDCVTDNLTGLMWAKNGDLAHGPLTGSSVGLYFLTK